KPENPRTTPASSVAKTSQAKRGSAKRCNQEGSRKLMRVRHSAGRIATPQACAGGDRTVAGPYCCQALSGEMAMNDLAPAALSDLLVNRKPLPFATDQGLGARARIGLIVLATDNTMESEWRAILGTLPGVAYYESRLPNSPNITPETLAEMEKDIEGATR